MKVIAINGSPRPKGNTEVLLNLMLDIFRAENWESEYFRIGAKPMQGCLACMKCFANKNMRCMNDKDDFNDIATKCFAADVILLGSPVYFTSMTAELKAFTDRLGLVGIANDRALSGKIGGAVVAARRGGATHVFDSLNHVFQISRMIIPGSTYWNFAIGLNPGEVENDAEGLHNIQDLAQTILWLSNAIKSYGKPFPLESK